MNKDVNTDVDGYVWKNESWKKESEKIPAKDWEPESNRTGWICPKCGRANAPWITSCNCTAQCIPHYPIPYYPAFPYEPPYTITCTYG